jgi:ATP-binding cassette subfamily B protein
MAELSVITQETLGVSGILLSKVFGRQQREIARYETENSNLAKLEVRQQMVGQSFFTTVQIFFSLTPVIVYVAAGVILNNGNTLTSGAIVAFTTLQSRLFFPIGQLLQVSVDLRTSLALFDRIYAYLDLKPSIVDKPDALAINPVDVRGEITFRDVDFSYGADAAAAANKSLDDDPDAPPTKLQLHGVSLEVKPGQLAALVGPSGAGKTTIGYLVPRLYDVVGGAVKLDGHDVRDLTSETIAAAVGSVTQESYLFHASIKDNLLYGRPDATEEQLVAAAKAAYIHDRIMEFPDGYDTIVGERGYRLSGGEKQRLAIARVLLHDPRVLILDEATSALDSESERMVQQALEDLMANRTTLAIAHRLSTIIAADVIYVIDGGRVVEQGNHAELLAADGVYARLYHEQYGDGEVEVVCEDGVIMRDGTVRLDDVFVGSR